jgi:hypothetical protein
MPTNRKPSTAASGDAKRQDDATRRQSAGTQPAATGANRGSPAASVMKQFQKTKTESSGRS